MEKRPTAEELRAAMSARVSPSEPVAYSRQRRRFLRGPLDWGETCIAARLGGAALAVWLLINYRRQVIIDEPWLSLPNKELKRMGVSQWAKSRALRLLENEGLIRVQRARGKTALVRLVRG